MPDLAYTLRDLSWVGSCLEVLKQFPEPVKDEIGYALHEAQLGKMHKHAKPLKGFKYGVFEICSRADKETYRAVYALKLGEEIYVLHAFQKKSKTGIKTPQKDIDLINLRIKEVLASYRGKQ